MRKITKLRRSVRAISPIISTLLLIAIAVVASLVAYAWVMGYIGFSTSKAGNALVIQSYTTSGNLVVYVQNTGQNIVHLKHDGSVYVNGNLKNILLVDGQDASNGQLDPIPVDVGKTVALTIDFQPTSGEQLNIKVVTAEGTTIQGSTTATTQPGTAQVSFEVNPASSGTTTPSATTPYTLGSSIQITANAASGNVFSYWSSDSTITISNDQSAVTVATINGDGTITGNFVSSSSPMLHITSGGSQTVLLGQISGAIIIQRLQDSTGSIAVNLGTSSKTGIFYQDQSPTTPITSIPIASQGGSATVYYKDSTVGASQLTFSYTGYSPAITTFTIQTVQTPVLTTLTISPGTASVSAGSSQAFTAQGFDQNGKSMGDFTASTTFSASGASVTGASVSSTTVGSYTVTGKCSGVTSNSATLTVTAGSAKTLTISPSTASITAGGSQPFTASAQDQYGNILGDVTSATTFSASPSGGTVAQNYVSETAVGSYTVTGTDGAATSTATLQVNAGSTVFSVSGFTSPITAGTPSSLTVTTQDQYGNKITGYTGTVHFTSSDSQAMLPADYTFTSADAGTHTFSGATLKTAGAQLITATDTADSSITGSQTGITVNAVATVTQFTFSTIGTQTAGIPFAVTITAADIYGNAVPSYSGTATLSDLSGSLNPTTATFAAGLCLNQQLTITKTIPGQDALTAQDSSSNLVGTSLPFTVNAGSALSFVVSGFANPVAAGTAGSVTVTAEDGYGNVVTGYAGTVAITSSDAQAVLPANAGLTNGVGSFSVTLKTAGTQSITATDTVTSSIAGSQTGIAVTGGSALSFVVSGFANPVAAGTAGSVTVTAEDGYGNVVTGYAGTVAITSSDAQAVLPANAGLTNGVGSFSVTLKTAGTQSITATDTVTSSIAGSQTGIAVTGGSLASFAFGTISSPQTAGTAFSITITAYDAYGNVATNYANQATLIDSSGSISPTGTSAFINGVCTVPVTITKTYTNDIITVSDPSGVTAKSGQFTVSPGALASFTISPISNPQKDTTSFSITVTAYDSSGNVKTDFAGPAVLSDLSGSLSPLNTGTFGAGVWTGSVKISATYTNDILTVKDSVSGITANSNTFNVVVGTVDHFVFTTIGSPQTAGTAFTVTITAEDSSGTIVTTYAGSASFTDLSGSISLKSTGVFTNGVLQASVAISKAYTSDTVTASDASTGATGTSNTFNVVAAPATQLVYTAGTSQSITSSTVSSVITVQLEDANGNPVAAGTNGVPVGLTTTDTTTGTFWSGTTKITSITIASGSPSASFYYSDTASGSPVLTAASTPLTPAITTFTISADKLVFSEGATQTLAPGQTSTAIQIEQETPTGGADYNILSTTTITLTTSSPTGEFSTTLGGTLSHSITVSVGILSDTSGNFYYVDSAAGTAMLTASAGGFNPGTTTFTIYTATLSKFTITATIYTVATGAPFSITITALDQQSNIMTSYTGTNTLSASTGSISPTSTGAFTNGVWTGSVSLNTAGSITISTSGGGATGQSSTFTVYTPTLNHFTVTASGGGNIGTQTAGTTFSITISALDQDGNTYTGYTGTNALTVSSGTIAPTTTGAFVAGVWTGSVTLTKAGTGISISTSGSGATGISNTFTVNAGTLHQFSFSTIGATQTAGTTFSVTITAQDQYGNTVTSYGSSTTLTETNGGAGGTVSPSPVTFTNGVYTHTVYVTKSGSGVTITATYNGVSSASNTFTVNAGTLDHFAFNTIATQASGTAFSVTITAYDAYGNVASYSGTQTLVLHNSSGSGTPTLSLTSVTFTNGVATFSETITCTGTHTVYLYINGYQANDNSNTFTV